MSEAPRCWDSSRFIYRVMATQPLDTTDQSADGKKGEEPMAAQAGKCQIKEVLCEPLNLLKGQCRFLRWWQNPRNSGSESVLLVDVMMEDVLKLCGHVPQRSTDLLRTFKGCSSRSGSAQILPCFHWKPVLLGGHSLMMTRWTYKHQMFFICYFSHYGHHQ